MKVKSRDQLHRFLDAELRLARWPARLAPRQAALAYLASKFEGDRNYSEAAVNALLRHWTAFDDPALLRRALFDGGYLRRTRDGSRYWLRDPID